MTEAPLRFAAIGRALAWGLVAFRAAPKVSLGYAAVFAALGALILGGFVKAGMTPLVVPAAGAFMLVGPITLAGFFGVARAIEEGRRPSADQVFAGFHRPPAALWALALVCALLFMIFVTDAGILYSYLVGGTRLFPADLLPPPATVGHFLLWASISGAFIACLLFAVSAFAVPLLCEGRSHLVQAVVASVRVVFRNFGVTLTWAVLLSSILIASIIALPLLPVTLPVLAYASHALYREALPR